MHHELHKGMRTGMKIKWWFQKIAISIVSYSFPVFFLESVLLIFLVFCVVLVCVFTLLVPCCDVRYDFRMKTIFGSSLPPVVYVICVCLHIMVSFLVLFVFVLCTQCCQFLWIVLFFLSPLWCSLTFII